MEIYNFNYNNKEYTLVDVYDTNDGKIVQINSDDDIELFFVDQNGIARNLSYQEDEKFREEHNLIDYGYVTATIKDLINFEGKVEKLDERIVNQFKSFFKEKLEGINMDIIDSPYINNRLNKLNYRINAKLNAYASDTVYIYGKDKRKINKWVITHETVHGIVNKSKITTKGIIEGITDRIVGELLPNGNYSQNYKLYEGEIQINDSGFGQEQLVVLAKQLEFALGSNYNFYEMLTNPHKQIMEFSKIYGPAKCRILMHKINKLYYNANIKEFKDVQEYMLEMVFDKKLDEVKDDLSAKEYFEELIKFGLLRGRINGKDEDLEKYYYKQLYLLKEKGINIDIIPPYREKTFYPCGDCYFRLNSYIESSIKARKDGKGNNFQILYNKDNTCVYIIIDGKLNYIHNASIDNRRMFLSNSITQDNSKIIPLENGNYLITGPDGIEEEARDTDASKIINEYFEMKDDETSIRR